MRVIAGTFRGRSLEAPPGHTTRPITDRAKETLFNILGHRCGTPGALPDIDVLDVFAGTGGLGIEALSRGARSCVFVERDRKALRALRANIEKLALGPVCRVLADNAWTLRPQVPGLRAFGLVFLDPPYRDAADELRVVDLLERLTPCLAADGLLVLRLEARTQPPRADLLRGLRYEDQRELGSMRLVLLTTAVAGEPGPQSARAATDQRLHVNEIFHSIQGEGTRAGLPCAFIRLAGCPLRCRWCDTTYAYEAGESLTIDEVLEHVRACRCPTVEVTGGEPLAQPAAYPLLSRLADEFPTVLLETSGSLSIAAVDPRVARIVDIKCPGSGEDARNDWSNIDRLTPRDEVKFVLADRADYEWATDVLRHHNLAARCPVIFAPVHGVLAPAELAGWILADGLPVWLGLQLHKLIWPGQTRGV